MDRTHITQQTSTTLPLRGELAHDAPAPRPLTRSAFSGPLQWALEGRGWSILRPLTDLVLLCVAVVLALGGVQATLHVSAVTAPLLALPPLTLALFFMRGLYRRRLRTLVLEAFLPVLSAVSVAAMSVAVLGSLINGQVPEQSDWLQAWFLALLGVGLGRTVLALAQRWARSRRLVGRPVLIVGAGLVGAQVARRLISHPEYGLAPVGFLDEEPPSVAEVGGREAAVLGTVEDLRETVRRTGARQLIIAFSSITDRRVSRVIGECQELGVEVSVVPRMFDAMNHRAGYDTVGGLPLLSFSAVDPDGLGFAVKHALDRVAALALLVLLSPLILCISVAVRLSSPGRAVFKQRRVGRDGRTFDLYKFRSMRMPPAASREGEREESPLEFLLGGDTAPGGVEGADRRTAVGRLLRRTSLDELPQLLNVLRGEMSIVGPRPERPEFVDLFGADIVRYGDRHRVKAGITGWAQVHGLRGQTSLAERVEWDNYYIAHWSLGLDLKILTMTVAALLRHAE